MDDARERLFRRVVAGDVGEGQAEDRISIGRLPDALSHLPLPDGTDVVGVIGGPNSVEFALGHYRIYLNLPGENGRDRFVATLAANGWTQAEAPAGFAGGFMMPMPQETQHRPDQFESPDGQDTLHLSEPTPGALDLFLHRIPAGSPHRWSQQLHGTFSIPQLESTPEFQVTPGGMSGNGGGRNFRVVMTGTIRGELGTADMAARLGQQLEAGGWQPFEAANTENAAIHTYRVTQGEHIGLGWLSVTRAPDGGHSFGTCGAEFQQSDEPASPAWSFTTLTSGSD